MKNVWKKIACFALVAAMALASAACGSVTENVVDTAAPAAETAAPATAETAAPENDPELVKFVEVYGEEFAKSFEGSSAETQQETTCKLSVEGDVLVITCSLIGVKNVPESQKSLYQDAYDATSELLTEQMRTIKNEAVPSLKKVDFIICEETGAVLATLHLTV